MHGLKKTNLNLCGTLFTVSLTVSPAEFYFVGFLFISGDSCYQFEKGEEMESILKVKTFPDGTFCQSRSIFWPINPDNIPLIC